MNKCQTSLLWKKIDRSINLLEIKVVPAEHLSVEGACSQDGCGLRGKLRSIGQVTVSSRVVSYTMRKRHR